MITMCNNIKRISQSELNILLESYENKNIYITKIDGKEIETLNDYMLAIMKAFKFPKDIPFNTNSIDSYNDWMRDLSWNGLDKFDGYILIIFNYDRLLEFNNKDKQIIMEEFCEVILPFWGKEIEYTVVGGVVKLFNIYLL